MLKTDLNDSFNCWKSDRIDHGMTMNDIMKTNTGDYNEQG